MADLSKEERKRIQLKPEELEGKKVMLFEEETKKQAGEIQIITLEDQIKNKSPLKQLQMQIDAINLNTKLLPFLKEQLKEEQPIAQAQNALKQIKNQIKMHENNIKVLRRQILTKHA